MHAYISSSFFSSLLRVPSRYRERTRTLILSCIVLEYLTSLALDAVINLICNDMSSFGQRAGYTATRLQRWSRSHNQQRDRCLQSNHDLRSCHTHYS